MSFYWVYDIPEWALCALMTITSIAFSAGGVLVTRGQARRLFGQNGMNDIVSYFLSATGVFYGITLGLIAVGAWQTYTSVTDKASNEAAALATICQDVRLLSDSPTKTKLIEALKKFTRHVIDEDWPLQRKGQIPRGGTDSLESVVKLAVSLDTQTEIDRIVVAEIYTRLNILIDLRRLRLESVTSGLPAPLYWVVIIGGLINVSITWCFVMEKTSSHVFLSGVIGALIGLLIFMVAAMDNPFRGEYSVGPGAFQIVFDRYFSN